MSALTDAFTAIANAIRNKKGVSTKYTPAQMPDAIASIQTGTDTSDATLDSGSRMLSGYTAYAKGTKYTGSMVNRGAVSQTLNPGGSYTVPAGYHDGNGTVSARNLNLQTKTQTVTPSANWSGTNTNNATINKDSSYDGMSQVNVNVPMLRDNTLMTADTVDTPGTVYNGNTSESNTQKLLRMHPTKDGMSYTGSYLYMKPNSYLGDATAADVLSGKTFSSANGIQVTGTGSSGPTSTVLWTNPNTSVAFTGQTINIQQRIPIRSYLKVTIKEWMGDDDSQVDKQYPDMLYTGNTVMSSPGIIKGVTNGTDTVGFTRFIYFHPGDTSSSGLEIEISNLYAYRRTDGTIPHNANNAFYIPIKIELITNI